MDLEKIQQFNEEQKRQQERQQELDKFDELGTRIEQAKTPVVQVDGTDLGAKIAELKDYLGQVFQVFAQNNQDTALVDALNEQFIQLIDELSKAQSGRDSQIQSSLSQLAKSLGNIDFKPSITTTVDTKPLVSVVTDIKKALNVKHPTVDLSEVSKGLKDVQKAINSQRFPVANYVLPFKDSSGKTVQSTLNEQGTWGYNAGTNGSLNLTGGKRVLQITAIAQEAAATITINGGDTITLPYGSTDKVSASITIEPKGNLTNPTIVFSSGVDAYFVEFVS